MNDVSNSDDVFRIAILGNFLGAESTPAEASGRDWSPIRATPETVMDLLGLRPALTIPSSPFLPSQTIEFSSLSSFEPGGLWGALEGFEPLRKARKTILEGGSAPDDPETGSPPPPSTPDRNTTRSSDAGPESSDSLEAILRKAESAGATEAAFDGKEGLDQFVSSIVRPHLVPSEKDQQERLRQVDGKISAAMSALLHDAGFQELESAWRSLAFLMSRADTSGKVRIYGMHVPKCSLTGSLVESTDTANTALSHFLNGTSLGSHTNRWSLVVGNYRFRKNEEDLETLKRVAKTTRSARVPFLTSIVPDGDSPLSQREQDRGQNKQQGSWMESEPEATFSSLRSATGAAFLGLTYPRFLVREPYGPEERPERSFDFSEAVTDRSHLLWGNGAFLWAALWARGFASEGPGFNPHRWLQMNGLPQACLEGHGAGRVISTERDLDMTESKRLMKLGVVPLISLPAQAGIRLGSVNSVSSDGAPLRAWWKELEQLDRRTP